MRKITARGMREHMASVVAAVLVIVTYYLAREPTMSADARRALAAHFRFKKHVISHESFAPRPLLQSREVHPSLARIRAWVGATGAAVTLADVDRDGLPNDLCLVDPRLNTLLVLPAPGDAARYEPFALDPVGPHFDPRRMAPTGSLVDDFDDDGDVDILVHYWGRTPVLFLRVTQSGGAADRAPTAKDYRPVELIDPRSNVPERWFTHAACQADVDGDGHLDLLFGNFFQDGADVLNAEGTGVATVMQAGKSNARNGGGAKLLLWTPPGKRRDPISIYRDESAAITELCGNGWVLAIGAADLDPDNDEFRGLPEIYIANDFGPDRLLHNRSTPGKPEFALCEGERHFTTPKSFVLGNDSYKGMGLDFCDVNGDGLFDIYVSNISEDFALHEGHFVFVSTGDTAQFIEGVAPYRQQSRALGLIRGGWGWDCRFVDFDNDGEPEAIQGTGFIQGTVNRWPELHALGTTNDRLVSNPSFWPRLVPPTADLSGHDVNPFYAQIETGRYANIAAELGLNDSLNTRGLAVADVDGDGRQDFVAANQWGPSVYFQNDGGESTPRNSFVGLHLILPPDDSSLRALRWRAGRPTVESPGRPAIGATALLELGDGRRRIAQVDGGSGHSGRSAPAIHFGLGASPPRELAVQLNWRDRTGRCQEEVVRLQPGNWYTIELGTRGEP